jgi:hypothetical protein
MRLKDRFGTTDHLLADILGQRRVVERSIEQTELAGAARFWGSPSPDGRHAVKRIETKKGS